jgi:hypothetical protein
MQTQRITHVTEDARVGRRWAYSKQPVALCPGWAAAPCKNAARAGLTRAQEQGSQPYTALDATIWSPASQSASSVHEMAAMPARHKRKGGGGRMGG